MTGLLTFALELSVRSAAAALCVGGILVLARARTGAVRHAAWTAVLCAMLLMPVLTSLAPAVPSPVLLPIDAAVPPVPDTVRLQRTAAEPIPSPLPPARGLRPAAAPRAGGPWWPSAVLAVYCLGAILLLARTAMGWRAARRLARATEPAAVPAAGLPVVQSDAIAAPLVIGVLQPRIVLPRAWTAWSEVKLRAVLAHESAHIRRRDAVIALLARLNLCIFWFHPLAWWLERQLAVTAEQACDEAGVRALGECRAYAEVLLEIAETVRSSGARLAWRGIGMTGAGALERRIDHLLLGGASRRISRKRMAAITVSCAAVILLAAGCRQKAGSGPASTRAENRPQKALYAYMAPVDFEASLLARALESSPRYDGTAAEAQRMLEQAKDVPLLLLTATHLVGMQSSDPRSVEAEPFVFGKKLVQRALELEPDSTWARQVANMAADREVTARLPRDVWQGPLESRRRAIEHLPEGARFRELAILAIAAGDAGVRARVIRHDEAGEKAAWQQAGAYAREAMEIAPQAVNHPDYGTAFFNANMVLGMAALEGGDAGSAAAYLLKAAEAPPTDALRYPINNARPWTMNWHFPAILTTALLQAGQGGAVATFRERYARLTVTGRVPSP